MIVTCKTCQKRYLIEKDDIGSKGRQVRCVSCGYSWQQYPIEETVVTIPPRPATFDPGYMAEVRERKKFPWMILIGGVFISHVFLSFPSGQQRKRFFQPLKYLFILLMRV